MSKISTTIIEMNVFMEKSFCFKVK